MPSRPIAVAFGCALAWAAAFGQSGRVQSNAAAPSAARAASASSGSSEVRFAGEVVDGGSFEREIGHDLVFRLIPLSGDMPGGWAIEIVPKAQPADDDVEFSGIVTPPYHFYNDRYVAGAYGYSTKEAVAITPRQFNFVLSVGDRRIAEDVVNSVLYPSVSSDQERQRISSEASDLRLGHGVFRILRARVTQGKAGKPDAIAWLKFDVALNFSPGLTLQSVLAPEPPSRR
jgi:hypothetical protein